MIIDARDSQAASASAIGLHQYLRKLSTQGGNSTLAIKLSTGVVWTPLVSAEPLIESFKYQILHVDLVSGSRIHACGELVESEEFQIILDGITDASHLADLQTVVVLDSLHKSSSISDLADIVKRCQENHVIVAF